MQPPLDDQFRTGRVQAALGIIVVGRKVDLRIGCEGQGCSRRDCHIAADIHRVAPRRVLFDPARPVGERGVQGLRVAGMVDSLIRIRILLANRVVTASIIDTMGISFFIAFQKRSAATADRPPLGFGTRPTETRRASGG